MRRREEVTVGAAWGVGKVTLAIGVTIEAERSFESRGVPMPTMAALAGLVLRFAVESR